MTKPDHAMPCQAFLEKRKGCTCCPGMKWAGKGEAFVALLYHVTLHSQHSSSYSHSALPFVFVRNVMRRTDTVSKKSCSQFSSCTIMTSKFINIKLRFCVARRSGRVKSLCVRLRLLSEARVLVQNKTGTTSSGVKTSTHRRPFAKISLSELAYSFDINHSRFHFDLFHFRFIIK